MGDLGVYAALGLALVALLKAMSSGYGDIIQSLRKQNADQQGQIDALIAGDKDCKDDRDKCKEEVSNLKTQILSLQAQVDSLRSHQNSRRKPT